jgi:hypothetical protein
VKKAVLDFYRALFQEPITNKSSERSVQNLISVNEFDVNKNERIIYCM